MLRHILVSFVLLSTLNLYSQVSENSCDCEVILIPKHERTPIFDVPNGKLINYVMNDTINEDYVVFQLLEIKDHYAYVVGSGVRIDTVSRAGWIELNNIGIYPVLYSTINLYTGASKSSEIKSSIKNIEYSPRNIKNCKADWLYVNYKVKNKIFEGWLSPDDQCANPYTTCN